MDFEKNPRQEDGERLRNRFLKYLAKRKIPQNLTGSDFSAIIRITQETKIKLFVRYGGNHGNL